MPDYYGTNMSATSSVTGARTVHHTVRNTISARPTITNVYPNFDEMPRVYKGFTTDMEIYGYNFDTSISVYLSCNKEVYANTNELSAISAFSLFENISGTVNRQLSAMYPAFSGIKLPSSYFNVETGNTMTVTISAPDDVGKIDIIIANDAGYGSFVSDLLTTGAAGSGVERVIEIKNP